MVIIDSKLPVFPNNVTEEQRSVYKLLDIVDHTYIRPDAKLMDKYPSTDGYIIVVDLEQRMIGRFDIQIKTLPDADVSQPRYQCDKPFLRYCEESQLPVLLIAVNAKVEKAWWRHMSRDFLRKLAPKIKKNSISVKLPLNQVISRSDTGYVAEWKTILEKDKRKVVDFELLQDRVAELEKLNRLLDDFPKPRHSIAEEDIKKLFLFLDTLNGALARDFQTIKDTFYPSYRQLGLAYNIFKPKELSYVIYPLKYGQNDLILREVKNLPKLMQAHSGLSLTHYLVDNPIRNNPVDLAYKYIREDTLKMLEKRYAKVLSRELCLEYIADFLEYTEQIFHYNEAEINLSKLDKLIKYFLPLWHEAYMEMYGLAPETLAVFNLESVLSGVSFKDKEAIYRTAETRYAAGERAKIELQFLSGEIDFAFLFHAISYLLGDGFSAIKRPYASRDHRQSSGLIYGWYDQTVAFEKIKFIFEALPTVYDDYLTGFFPNLRENLKFYSGRDLVIVNFHHWGAGTAIGREPYIEMFSLRTAIVYTGPKIRIFLNGEGSPVLGTFGDHWRSGIDIDGQHFELFASRGYQVRNLYSKFTLMTFLYEDLIDNFKNYFKTLTKL